MMGRRAAISALGIAAIWSGSTASVIPFGISASEVEEQTFSRSDHDIAADWYAAYGRPTDAIASTRPELAEWYVGRADYYFRQSGSSRVAGVSEDETIVHPETGWIILHSPVAVEEMIASEPRGWLFADVRFYGSTFTDDETREFIEANTVHYGNDDWHNMEIYYWGPDAYVNEFDGRDWDESVVDWDGNVFVGDTALALGRSVESTIRFGENTGETDGSVVIETLSSDEYSSVMEIEGYGDEDRYTRVSISATGDEWTEIYDARDGWDERSIVLPPELHGDTVRLRIDGGSEQGGHGGLVKRLRVFPRFQESV